MGYVVGLVNSTPPARSDEVSYTSVHIEEAAEEAGPWTIVDTKTTGPDADPESPATRDLTTRNATLPSGWYRLTWVSGTDTSTPSEPVQNTASLAGGVRPTIFDVAQKVRSRTKIRGGNEIGTFNTQTRPTGDEVEGLIGDASNEVLGKVKVPESGTQYEKRVRGAIALYAAMEVELSFFPEQVGTAKSPYAAYEKLYGSRIKALIAESETGEPQGMGDTDAPADPAWTFPGGEMVGFSTRW